MSPPLSPFGIFHTAISLVAVAAGVLAFVRDGRIDFSNRAGQTYVWMTILSCLTGFFIFAHGGFGKPHALGIITLATLAVAALARWSGLFGRAALSVETVALSLTFFFHMIPAVTETLTRLPSGAPLLDSPDSPVLVGITGVMFVIFLAGATMQVRKLRARRNARQAPFGTKNHA
ncbi:hypothetical protein [Massilia cavernae]|uniref:DUF2306 domain-containing protein n=1 Tax=Massilia cavernae TaxID=2320864 RepID=A0A418X6U8_9BURK|nr:hypothetical protein [Massilia cavernae]RJG08226.1 hypothetical protein D3872_25025 [Massilia cavernae]